MSSGPPRNVMKSTWRTADKKTWGIAEWTFTILGISPTNMNQDVPVFKTTDKLPYIPDSAGHIWILTHAAWPMILQQLYCWYYGRNPATPLVFALYALAYTINGILELRVLKRMGHKYGFFDGEHHKRDQVPDTATFQVWQSLLTTSNMRPLFTLFFSYKSSQQPIHANWLAMIVEAALYGVVLDFYFYWYHRVMHENDGLWRYHRTHHLTKHPNALLTLFAGHEQEFFDIFGIPMLTYLTLRLIGLPMGFYEWWVCHQYVVWSELYGHCGVRVWSTAPTLAAPFLRIWDAEIRTEDHDLHHRKGWKDSFNYGKQTMLWDKAFGTYHTEVYEQRRELIDWSRPVHLILE